MIVITTMEKLPESCYDDHEFCVTLWRYVLEKWMEEQDAKEET